MTNEYRPEDEYADLLDGMSRQAFFERLQDSARPEDLSPLPFSPDLAGRLQTPLTHELAFPALRRDVVKELGAMVGRPELGLNADLETVQDLRFGLSEAVQNGFRNGGGVHHIDVQQTETGGLYTAVSNIAVTYPTGPVWHLRPGQRPLRLDRNVGRRSAELADDEHGWGLGLIGQFALNADGGNMGFYTERIASIPNISTGDTVEITRLVFWSVYARSRANEMPTAA